MNYEKKYKEDLESAKKWYKVVKEQDNQRAVEILEKLFPELKESEDERIRKAIINVFATHKDYEIFFGASVKDILAWLEKQGEQKHTELPKGEDYGIDGLWHAIRILEKTLGNVEGYQSDDGILEHKCAISAVKELYEKKPTAWSEEDEKNLTKCLETLIAQTESVDLETINKEWRQAIDWLNSLKDRVQPQQKQEWSEEDEKRLKSCLNILQAKGIMGATETINTKWLKSLKERIGG